MKTHESTLQTSVPLYAQVLLAASCGAILGLLFGQEPYVGRLGNQDLGRLGMLIVELLKTLALPLIFFAILDALVHTKLRLGQGFRLLGICLINVSVAMTIGLIIMNLWQPGHTWEGRMGELLQTAPSSASPTTLPVPGAAGLSSDHSTSGEPSGLQQMASLASENMVLTVALTAFALGASLRALAGHHSGAGIIRISTWTIDRGYRLLKRGLDWIIRLVPLGVFAVLAHVVGRSGIEILSALWVFLTAMMLGLLLHALIYYPSVAWMIGGKPPRIYLGRGADAILTALSCNSSLATVPITLRCLDRMHVSPESARLAACVGTNLNNDGITLYEAMAALFIAQALGYDLSITAQFTVVLTSIMAGAGAAGIPEAGLVVLPLVLSSAGLPAQVIAAAIPLIMTVDWIIARTRSGVNVMSDMVVAILLDRTADAMAMRSSIPQPGPHASISIGSSAD
ncbi:dicarboxylate:amino acid:cation symporter DAACS family protein [Nitrospira sp.]|nr:dicarboxylate:amino acid:cation symporter DAACS family protein [Nitrospira sp.]